MPLTRALLNLFLHLRQVTLQRLTPRRIDERVVRLGQQAEAVGFAALQPPEAPDCPVPDILDVVVRAAGHHLRDLGPCPHDDCWHSWKNATQMPAMIV